MPSSSYSINCARRNTQTVEGCKAACMDDINCAAFDVNTNFGCRFYDQDPTSDYTGAVSYNENHSCYVKTNPATLVKENSYCTNLRFLSFSVSI